MADEIQTLPVLKTIGYSEDAYTVYTTAESLIETPSALNDWAPVYGAFITVNINGCVVQFPCDNNKYKVHPDFIAELGKKLRFENSLPPIYTTTETPIPPEPVSPVNFVTGEEYTKIYFNTSLSVEDTATILATLTYTPVEDEGENADTDTTISTCVVFQITDKLQLVASTDGTDYMMVLSGVDGEGGHDTYIFSTVADTSETPEYVKGWQNLTEAGTFTSVYNIPTSEQGDLAAVENIDCMSAASFEPAEPEYIITDKGLVIDRNGNYIKTNPGLNNFPIINKL